MTLLTMIVSSLRLRKKIYQRTSRAGEVEGPRTDTHTHLSSNQPFWPRSQPAVWHGPAGIRPYASRPTQRVKIPYVHSRSDLSLTSVQLEGWLGSTCLDRKEPTPPGLSCHAAHVQDAVRQERRQDVGDAHARPEETESDGQLGVLVEVRQVENDLLVEVCEFLESVLLGQNELLPFLPRHQSLTSGMKPPWRMPRSARVVRKEDRPESQN